MPTPYAAALKQTLQRKQPTIGSWLSLGDCDVCEMMCKAGFDWLVIDQEHSAIGLREMRNLIQIIDLAGLPALVRVANNDATMIKQALDCGASGIIIPMIKTVPEAMAAVSAALYPPAGNRGVGLYRAQSFGRSFPSYRKSAEQNTVIIVQIEHHEGVKNLNEILAVPGVDGFIAGPYDLSGSYGKPGDFESEEFTSAISQLETVAKSDTHVAGLHVVHGKDDALANAMNKGYTFIAYGSDMLFLNEKLEQESELVTLIREQQSVPKA